MQIYIHTYEFIPQTLTLCLIVAVDKDGTAHQSISLFL